MDIDGVYVDNITIKLIQFGSSFPKEKLVPKNQSHHPSSASKHYQALMRQANTEYHS